MRECPICGKHTLKQWTEKYEVWGRMEYETYTECTNSNCGEEDDDED